MILNFKKAGVLVLNYGKMVDSVPDADGKVTQKQVFQGSNVIVRPGLNKIDDEAWKELSNEKKYPDVAAMLESGDLSVVEQIGKKKESEKDEISSLEPYAQSEAIEIAKGQMDADVLKSWKTKEKRPMVLKAINEQLKSVKAADEIIAGGKG